MADANPSAGILQREDLIALKCYWKQFQGEYTSGLPDYIGRHYLPGAGTDDPNWEVWKFTWTGTDCTGIQGPITGAYDDRATLAWI